MSAIRTAIYNKFITKVSGSYVDFYDDISGRLYYEQAPSDVTEPYAVFTFISGKPMWWFAETTPDVGEDILVQFTIYDKKDNGLSAIEGYVGHMHTLYDFCSLTISGYTLMEMRRISYKQPILIDDMRQAMTTYRIKIDKD